MGITMTQEARFWDKIARKYAKQPVSDPDAYEHTLGRVRSYLKADDDVLEIGCGTGTTALKLADACGTLLATDISPEMITIAREKPNEVGSVTFNVADTLVQDVPSASKDVVMAFNILHLVPDLGQTLARTAEIVKPGGYFISKTPCLAGAWYFRPIIGAMRLFGMAPPVAFLATDALDAAIKAAGFDLVEVAENNKGKRGHFVVARKA